MVPLKGTYEAIYLKEKLARQVKIVVLKAKHFHFCIKLNYQVKIFFTLMPHWWPNFGKETNNYQQVAKRYNFSQSVR